MPEKKRASSEKSKQQQQLSATIRRKQAWLTALGSWFRRFRPDSGLWDEVAVNHRWFSDHTQPSLQTPGMFVIADPDMEIGRLYAEAARRMDAELPGTDRIAVGISQVGRETVACLRLDEFLDILTDALISRVVPWSPDALVEKPYGEGEDLGDSHEEVAVQESITATDDGDGGYATVDREALEEIVDPESSVGQLIGIIDELGVRGTDDDIDF